MTWPRSILRPLGGGRGFAREFSWWVFGFACWVPVFIFVNDNVVIHQSVNGPSMYPYFNEDIDRTTRPYRTVSWRWNAQSRLERGMVVTFYSPLHPEKTAVKRIIALEGDEVESRLPDGPGKVQVPQNHIWVEGDGEASKSVDSNNYGPISKALVTGRITCIVWPLSKVGLVDWPEDARNRVAGRVHTPETKDLTMDMLPLD